MRTSTVFHFSAQWVQSWGGDGTGLINFAWEFTTAWHFGLPVPALAPYYVGRPIGRTRRVLDAYGFQLTCATLSGDGYRSCHDSWLAHVLADLRDMGVPCEREVAGLFRGLLPPVAARAFDAMPWRERRGMVPDARMRLKDAEGAVQLLLA